MSFDGEYLGATFGYHHRMLELTYHTTVGTTQGMVGLEESYLGQLLDQRIPLITTTRLISVWKWLLEQRKGPSLGEGSFLLPPIWRWRGPPGHPPVAGVHSGRRSLREEAG